MSFFENNNNIKNNKLKTTTKRQTIVQFVIKYIKDYIFQHSMLL